LFYSFYIEQQHIPLQLFYQHLYEQQQKQIRLLPFYKRRVVEKGRVQKDTLKKVKIKQKSLKKKIEGWRPSDWH